MHTPSNPEQKVLRCQLGSAGKWAAPILTDAEVQSPLRWAIADWHEDVLAAARVKQEWWTAPGRAPAVIIAGVAEQSQLLAELAERRGFRLPVSPGEADSFAIGTVRNPWPGIPIAVVVSGANPRATMHGMYKLSEQVLGTDPLQGWTSIARATLDDLVWHGFDTVQQPPAVRWRGFFINDEDALLSWRGGPEDYAVAPEVQKLIIRTLCRLGGNMLAPSMWGAYMDLQSRREMAERGIFYTASHLEVLLCNPSNCWGSWCLENVGRHLPYSFTRHPEQLEAFWRESVARNCEYPVIWPVGLRGDRDCSFWQSDPDAPATMPERARVVGEAVKRQLAILRDMLPNGSEVVTSLTMRDEVLDLFETGELELPDETLLVWDDLARRSTIRALPDNKLAGRRGGNGIYYHLTFCQNPRMQYVPPGLIHGELRRAFAAPANDYLLLNVGNLREVCLQAQFTMELAIAPLAATAAADWPSIAMRRILAARYGEPLADRLVEFYNDFTTIEYGYRVSQVTDCVAPLVTTRELYDNWEPVSAADFVEQQNEPAALREFARKIRFDDLPERCWCFDPARLSPMRLVWDALLERLDRLAVEVPPRARDFFAENLRLQVQTSRLFNAWAAAVLAGFDRCADGDFARAAVFFDEAAAALEALDSERSQVAVGEAGNWFRGEYQHMFKKSLWTLKPRWHAEDTRLLAAIARRAAEQPGLVPSSSPEVRKFPLTAAIALQ